MLKKYPNFYIRQPARNPLFGVLPEGSVAMKTYDYVVYVDDNFHYMDEDERYEIGKFSDCSSAVAACKKVVDRCLQEGFSETSTLTELHKGYLLFGDDSFIMTNDPDCKFSARDYARLRCEEMCGGSGQRRSGTPTKSSKGFINQLLKAISRFTNRPPR